MPWVGQCASTPMTMTPLQLSWFGQPGAWPFSVFCTVEFTLTCLSNPSPIRSSDVAVDSHADPTTVCILLRWAVCDPFGNGVHIFMGKTGTSPSVWWPLSFTIWHSIRPSQAGPLFIWQDDSALIIDVSRVRELLTHIVPNATEYAGHSFRIGAG